MTTELRAMPYFPRELMALHCFEKGYKSYFPRQVLTWPPDPKRERGHLTLNEKDAVASGASHWPGLAHRPMLHPLLSPLLTSDSAKRYLEVRARVFSTVYYPVGGPFFSLAIGCGVFVSWSRSGENEQSQESVD